MSAVAKSTVTLLVEATLSVTVNCSTVVPAFPSTTPTLFIDSAGRMTPAVNAVVLNGTSGAIASILWSPPASCVIQLAVLLIRAPYAVRLAWPLRGPT